MGNRAEENMENGIDKAWFARMKFKDNIKELKMHNFSAFEIIHLQLHLWPSETGPIVLKLR